MPDRKLDLNRLKIPKPGVSSCELAAPVDFSSKSNCRSVEVYFRSLKEKLIEHINAADFIFGCVAWLTDLDIIRALQKKSVMFVVQKEDFLRPDDNSCPDDWKSRLHAEYDKLWCSLEMQSLDNMIEEHAFFFYDPADAISCVGNHNSQKKLASPRMHNKFLVFAAKDDSKPMITKRYGVWTGSFNLTGNASSSLENAVYISKPEIAEAYFQEFGQIWMLSEPLDWTSDWVAPMMDFEGMLEEFK